MKEAYEDYKCFLSDEKINDLKAIVLEPLTARKKKTLCSRIHVGDMVYLVENERVPADMIVLSKSSGSEACHVQTSSLDGETDLKTIYAVPQLQDLSAKVLCNMKGTISCDLPRHQTNMFHATISIEQTFFMDEDSRLDSDVFGCSVEDLDPECIQVVDGDKDCGEQIDDLLSGESFSVNEKNFLMMGSFLKSTKWVIGICVYAGYETKMCLNSTVPKLKSPVLNSSLNNAVMIIFVFMMLVSALMAYFHYFFSVSDTAKSLSLSVDRSFVIVIFTSILSYIVLFNYFIPLSLVVTIDFAKFAQSMFMQWDLKMFHNDRGCNVNVWSLCDDLDKVECIFSDKTGTLTENVMSFKACVVNNRIYYSSEDEAYINGIKYVLKQERWKEDRKAVTNFLRYMALCHSVKTELYEQRSGDKLNLASMMEMYKRKEQFSSVNYSISYKTTSPDEEALCKGTMSNDVVFVANMASHIFLSVFGRIELWMVLLELEFTSARSRMSVVLRSMESKKIMLLCKGADYVIYSRLKRVEGDNSVSDLDGCIGEFCIKGYRSLVFGFREMEEEEWRLFYERWNTASKDLEAGGRLKEALEDELERDLILLGATAVEDKLQDGVVETIEKIRQAGIGLWVLTGDKQDIAINIGYSASIIPPDTEIIKLNYSNKKELREILIRYLICHCELSELEEKVLEVNLKEEGEIESFGKDEDVQQPFHELKVEPMKKKKKKLKKVKTFRSIKEAIYLMHTTNSIENEVRDLEYSPMSQLSYSLLKANKAKRFSLAIDGESLNFIFGNFCELFLLLSSHALSVICSRITPLQKAKIVYLVSRGVGIYSLAIGDGENDVSMIREARIGIGVYGVEKSQASRVSDFSIPRFKDLQRLIFIHGNYNTIRNKMIIYYSFYKNVAFFFPQIIYSIYSGFSSQSLYSDFIMSFFNIIFSSMPIFILGIFEKNISEDIAFHNPVDFKNRSFKIETFLYWLLMGIIHATITFFFNYFAWSPDYYENGKNLGIFEFGISIMVCLYFIINGKLMLEIRHWVIPTYLSFILSFILYISSLFILSNSQMFPEYYHSTEKVFSSPKFYLILILSFFASLFFDYTIKILKKPKI